jgi:hypothetical protein
MALQIHHVAPANGKVATDDDRMCLCTEPALLDYASPSTQRAGVVGRKRLFTGRSQYSFVVLLPKSFLADKRISLD